MLYQNKKYGFKIKTSILLSLFVMVLVLTSCQSKPDTLLKFDNNGDLSNHKDVLVLLHGLLRSEVAMRPAQKFFESNEYKVVNLSYPSTDLPIEELVSEHLKPAIDDIELERGQKLHFVTHSLGGILVRYYLKHYPEEYIGRVVMIAPPNQGTELAGIFSDSEWFNAKLSPAAKQLRNGDKSWVKQLGSVNFELGVIAGNYNANWITDWLLPGDDDGVVTVESTKVDNMNDFLLYP